MQWACNPFKRPHTLPHNFNKKVSLFWYFRFFRLHFPFRRNRSGSIRQKLKMDFTSSCLRLHPTTENCMAKCVEQQAHTTWNLALISWKTVGHFGTENLIGLKLNFWQPEHLTTSVYAQPCAWVCALKRETESKASLWCSPTQWI